MHYGSNKVLHLQYISMSTVINVQEAGVVTVAPTFYTNLL